MTSQRRITDCEKPNSTRGSLFSSTSKKGKERAPGFEIEKARSVLSSVGREVDNGRESESLCVCFVLRLLSVEFVYRYTVIFREQLRNHPGSYVTHFNPVVNTLYSKCSKMFWIVSVRFLPLIILDFVWREKWRLFRGGRYGEVYVQRNTHSFRGATFSFKKKY